MKDTIKVYKLFGQNISNKPYLCFYGKLVSWNDLAEGFNVAFMISIGYSCWSYFAVYDCNFKHERYNQNETITIALLIICIKGY